MYIIWQLNQEFNLIQIKTSKSVCELKTHSVYIFYNTLTTNNNRWWREVMLNHHKQLFPFFKSLLLFSVWHGSGKMFLCLKMNIWIGKNDHKLTLNWSEAHFKGFESVCQRMAGERHIMAAKNCHQTEQWLTLLFACSLQCRACRAGQLAWSRVPVHRQTHMWQNPRGLMETLDSRGACELWANRFASTA